MLAYWLAAALLLALAWRWRLALTRAFLLAALHTVYRIRVRGLESLPPGGALLVANHLSHADALFVGASIPRRVYFLMHRSFFRAPVVGAFAKLFDTIPVAAEDSAAEKAESLARAAELARSGELVCIFAEGAISRTGHLLGFKRGLETIAGTARVPIVPVALDRVWGSIFSFSRGRVFWKLPQRLPYPIDVHVGRPLPPASEAWRVRDALAENLADAREQRARASRSLGYRFVRSARKHAGRVALVDADGTRVRYGELLRESLVLAAVIAREFPEPRVGVLGPAGRATVTLSLALTLAGKTSVHLDRALDARAREELARAAGLVRVLEPGARAELAARARSADRLRARLLDGLPGLVAARLVDPVPAGDRVATVLFTRGTTGPPRGVRLTHANLAANMQSLAHVFALAPEDGLLAVLPLSHGLGYGPTLWLPLLAGARAICLPDASDARELGRRARREAPSLLLASPVHYAAWIDALEPADLASLRLCVCGGERLPPELASAWRARFGRELLAGYAASELAPVASVNVPDFERGRSRQENARAGSFGRALPGIALRIVDPVSGALLAPGAEGLLLVRGANVMAGYLEDDALTSDVLRAGWFVTGDLAHLDRDGFLFLHGRCTPAASVLNPSR